MKKRISKLLLFMMVSAAAFSLTACGLEKIIEKRENTRREETSSDKKDEEKGSSKDAAGTEDNKTTDKTETEENKTENKTENGNTNASGFGVYDTMADYVNSSEVQDALNMSNSQLSGTGMKVDITAEGNKMVYTFTYESLTKQDGMAESVESAVKSQDSTFQGTANTLKVVVKEANPAIVIKYVDCNGEIIYEKEYAAE